MAHRKQSHLCLNSIPGPVLLKLPKSQAKTGRHLCVHCAFEAGRKQGFEEGQDSVYATILTKIKAWLGV
jgi:hypothetical protein